MAQAKKVKPQKRSVVLWDRMYTVLRYDAPPDEQIGPLEPRTMGMLDFDARKIHVRACPSPTEEIRTIIHELVHHALAEDYAKLSEKRMGKMDGALVTDLEAFGVDLSPLLKGYK